MDMNDENHQLRQQVSALSAETLRQADQIENLRAALKGRQEVIGGLMMERAAAAVGGSIGDDHKFNSLMTSYVIKINDRRPARELNDAFDKIAEYLDSLLAGSKAGNPAQSDADENLFYPPKAALKREDWDTQTRRPKVEPQDGLVFPPSRAEPAGQQDAREPDAFMTTDRKGLFFPSLFVDGVTKDGLIPLFTAPELTEWFWRDGAPAHPWDKESFVAETTFGRVVLRPLGEDHTYDYTTGDHTYVMRSTIKRWAQFPDSEYVAAPVEQTRSALASAENAPSTAAVSVAEPASQQDASGVVKIVPAFSLYMAVNRLVTYIGMHGEVDRGHALVEDVMNELHKLDGGKVAQRIEDLVELGSMPLWAATELAVDEYCITGSPAAPVSPTPSTPSTTTGEQATGDAN